MRAVLSLALAGALATATCMPACAQADEAAPAAPGAHWLLLTFDRAGIPVPHWEASISASGVVDYADRDMNGVQHQSRFVLSADGMERLKSAARLDGGLAACETHAKGIANMGTKSLTIWPVAGGPPQHCQFNFSHNPAVENVANYLQQMAETMQAGEEISRLERFDRLGLDAEVRHLADEVTRSEAVELAGIRPVLLKLVADPDVMSRVHEQAQHLLDLAAKEQPYSQQQ